MKGAAKSRESAWLLGTERVEERRACHLGVPVSASPSRGLPPPPGGRRQAQVGAPVGRPEPCELCGRARVARPRPVWPRVLGSMNTPEAPGFAPDPDPAPAPARLSPQASLTDKDPDPELVPPPADGDEPPRLSPDPKAGSAGSQETGEGGSASISAPPETGFGTPREPSPPVEEPELSENVSPPAEQTDRPELGPGEPTAGVSEEAPPEDEGFR